jgi:hypothetical protein
MTKQEIVRKINGVMKKTTTIRKACYLCKWSKIDFEIFDEICSKGIFNIQHFVCYLYDTNVKWYKAEKCHEYRVSCDNYLKMYLEWKEGKIIEHE